MKKAAKRTVGIFLALVMVGCFAGCADGAPSGDVDPGATQAPPPERAPEWTEVLSRSGEGIIQTQSFDVASREWRVTWVTRNEPFENAGIFQIMVHDAETDELITLAANLQGVGGDTSYVRSPPGRYYLGVNSGNVEWEITVEDQGRLRHVTGHNSGLFRPIWTLHGAGVISDRPQGATREFELLSVLASSTFADLADRTRSATR